MNKSRRNHNTVRMSYKPKHRTKEYNGATQLSKSDKHLSDHNRRRRYIYKQEDNEINGTSNGLYIWMIEVIILIIVTFFVFLARNGSFTENTTLNNNVMFQKVGLEKHGV